MPSDYDDAFQAFTTAKQLLRPFATQFIQMNNVVLAKKRETMASLNTAVYGRWRKQLENEATYRVAVLTSHPRSGTTLVEQVLDSHEQLKSADEFDVFTEWIHQPIVRRFRPNTPLLTILDHVPHAVWRQARATYWKQTEAIFDEPLGDRMLIDKNPGMMIMLPFVNWAFPEMKMLIALRDPRDVVLSCFMQNVSLTPISVIGSHWRMRPMYYAAFDENLAEDSHADCWIWLEFRYEDVVGDLEREARRILDFLGLPWDDKVLKFYEHARKNSTLADVSDVTQPVYHKSIGRWKNYAKYFEPALKTLEPFVAEFGYGD